MVTGTAKLGMVGDVLAGLPQLHQRVRMLVGLPKGTVPHEPEQGVDWLQILDLPVREAVPKLVAEVDRNLRHYLPEVKHVRTEVVMLEPGKVLVRVYWHAVARREREVTEVSFVTA